MTSEKETYYQSLSIVEKYEYRRFMRGGGAYVSEKEQETIRALIRQFVPCEGIALDCPSGTGRFLRTLAREGFKVYAVDTSSSMLQFCRRYPAEDYLEASADHIPMTDAKVRLWLMSRFCFHFKDPLPFLQEAQRVLQQGGFILFDVYNWTPRQWIPGKQHWLGGRVAVHSEQVVQGWADDLGFEVVARVPIFLLAPYLYSWIPLWLTKVIEGVGSRLIPSLRAKTYYLLQKLESAPRDHSAPEATTP